MWPFLKSKQSLPQKSCGVVLTAPPFPQADNKHFQSPVATQPMWFLSPLYDHCLKNTSMFGRGRSRRTLEEWMGLPDILAIHTHHLVCGGRIHSTPKFWLTETIVTGPWPLILTTRCYICWALSVNMVHQSLKIYASCVVVAMCKCCND